MTKKETIINIKPRIPKGKVLVCDNTIYTDDKVVPKMRIIDEKIPCPEALTTYDEWEEEILKLEKMRSQNNEKQK